MLSFDEAIARYARDAEQRNEPLSLIVIALANEQGDGRQVRGCIGRIRDTIRPTDLTGLLSATEVGVVLLDTPHDGASAVRQRLVQMLTSDAEAPLAATSVGIASRDPGAAIDSLVRRARESAAPFGR